MIFFLPSVLVLLRIYTILHPPPNHSERTWRCTEAKSYKHYMFQDSFRTLSLGLFVLALQSWASEGSNESLLNPS